MNLLRAPTAIRLVALASVWAILIGCGRSERDTSRAPSPAVQETRHCPAPSDGEVRGYFSIECVRSLVSWKFELPLLGERYATPIFDLNPPHYEPLLVTYRPSGTDPVLLLEVFPKGRILDAGPLVPTENGSDVGIGPLGTGLGGTWEDSGASYSLLVDGADTPANRRLILAVADSTLSRTPIK